MSITAPPLYKKSAEEVVAELRSGLAAGGFPATATAGAGEAMVRLFGRLADLIIARLNQAPENHFRAFLETAGVDLLPPRPARTEITFYPAKDAPPVIRVPAGTQVAAKKSDKRPEIVFETERDLNVVRAELASCIVVDPVRVSDRSDKARVDSGTSYAAFQGEDERQRILYLGDDALFVFPDEASRENGTVTLDVTLAVPGRPDLDGWRVRWLYFDGTSWQDLVKTGGAALKDGTDSFSKSGRITFTRLPPLTRFAFEKSGGAWLACRLSGGSGRDHLPIFAVIRGEQEVDIPAAPGKPADAAFSAIHAGAAFIPLEASGEFFPLGQRPGRLDCLYLKADEAFAKEGARVEITMDLVGMSEREQSALIAEPSLEWSYLSDDGWRMLGLSSRQGVEGSILGFDDQTGAFTHGGNGVKVGFTVPEQGGGGPRWASAEVGGQKGLWLRVRVLAGGYGLKPPETDVWEAPPVLAPSVKNLKISYGGFSSSSGAPLPLEEVGSLVDSRFSSHCFAREGSSFAPFSSSCDLPALYLGFSCAFPGNAWLQILLDVDEERIGATELPLLLWEYWSVTKGAWAPLPASDESNGMKRRGYLGFNAPPDLGLSVEFGRELSWLRVRPHLDPPLAAAPADRVVTSDSGGEAVVTLDASASRACNRQGIAAYRWNLLPEVAHGGLDQQVATSGSEALVTLDASATAAQSGRDIVRYHWRLVSSSHLIARAGADLVATTSGTEATVSLDASGSNNAAGGTIRSYMWRKLIAETVEPQVTPYLRGVRCNTAPALNGMSITEEVLGSGNGKSGQRCGLLRAPVMVDLKLYVRETDHPPADELDALRREIAAESGDDDTTAFPLVSESGQGVWVRWQRVDHFFVSGQSSRHYMLDPRNGVVIFGDGTRGRIPPLGRDNIKAVWYRPHQGIAGNVESGAITVLRNPGGELAALKRVANFETAVGGGDAETAEQIRERGPKTIKHRGKAITLEDFAWLARDASGEVAAAWCLPTRDRNGKIHEGWVTVVIIPKGLESRPFPRPPLQRLVREYLESRALLNLSSDSRIIVKGPAYIQVTASVKIVPTHAEKGDEVKLFVERRLEEYFHPLTGGPRLKGWELGRNVYISEVFAEIEGVPGVDHVAELTLDGSLQQFRVALLPRQWVNHPAAEGSRVGTFDDRLRLILSEPIEAVRTIGAPQPLWAALHGFSAGERVRIVDSANRSVVDELTICGLSTANDSATLTLSSAMTECLPPAESLALLSGDERVRIPIAAWEEGEGETVTARLMTVMPGRDAFCIVTGGERYPEFEFMEVTSVERRKDRVTIPEGHLLFSGEHNLEMLVED
jgi:hypothetical protein